MNSQALEKVDVTTVGEVQYLTAILEPKDVFHLYTFALGECNVWQEELLIFGPVKAIFVHYNTIYLRSSISIGRSYCFRIVYLFLFQFLCTQLSRTLFKRSQQFYIWLDVIWILYGFEINVLVASGPYLRPILYFFVTYFVQRWSENY